MPKEEETSDVLARAPWRSLKGAGRGGYGSGAPVDFDEQLDSDGPSVLVRNTFLELEEDRLVMPDLRRIVTEPGGRAPVEATESSDDEEDDEGDLSPLPPQPVLERNVTKDWFERRDEWAWTQRLPCPASPQAALLPASPGADPSSPATSPSVISPSVVAPVQQLQQPMYYMAVPMLVPLGPEVTPQVREPERGWPPPPPAAPAPATFGSSPVAATVEPEMPPPPERVASLTQGKASSPTVPAAESSQAPVETRPAAGSEDSECGMSAQPPLSRVYSVQSGFFRVNWTVAARLLKTKDTKAVSPAFEMTWLPGIPFKIVLQSIETQARRGGASFKKSKGKGTVLIKCEAGLEDLPECEAVLSFRISVGCKGKMSEPRGPVTHNFSLNATSGLPEEDEVWDFSAAVDEDSQRFCVCVEFVPSRKNP